MLDMLEPLHRRQCRWSGAALAAMLRICGLRKSIKRTIEDAPGYAGRQRQLRPVRGAIPSRAMRCPSSLRRSTAVTRTPTESSTPPGETTGRVLNSAENAAPLPRALQMTAACRPSSAPARMLGIPPRKTDRPSAPRSGFRSTRNRSVRSDLPRPGTGLVPAWRRRRTDRCHRRRDRRAVCLRHGNWSKPSGHLDGFGGEPA
ncbi:hypothetical protein ABIF64_005917 [Bradyrhizobium japonicum]|uniref:Transposase n=1 Tax=Bradyrhizobium japonicum TaxID=375 RepID=A0ABV2RY85_BRAJP